MKAKKQCSPNTPPAKKQERIVYVKDQAKPIMTSHNVKKDAQPNYGDDCYDLDEDEK